MKYTKTLFGKLQTAFRRYALRDPFLLEVSRWFKARGDSTLRLDYPLDSKSVVFDLGGYHGDFAAAINDRYRCKVCIFEPVPEFYQICLTRFQNNDKIVCFNYGLSSSNGHIDISLEENGSSFFTKQVGPKLNVEIRSVVDCIHNLEIEKIDLMKINIEGGEFDVLPALVSSGTIKQIDFLQVQFHNFIIDADRKRDEIRKQLMKSHNEMWCYPFVWESWLRRR